MSKYEQLMSKSDKCMLLALRYANKNEQKLVDFYLSASRGYKIKARKLTVKEGV